MDFTNLHSSVESMDDYAEEYVFNRLSSDDQSAYEAHLLLCEKCRKAVERTDDFIKLLRRASEDGPAQ